MITRVRQGIMLTRAAVTTDRLLTSTSSLKIKLGGRMKRRRCNPRSMTRPDMKAYDQLAGTWSVINGRHFYHEKYLLFPTLFKPDVPG